MIQAVEDLGKLDNTLIIYISGDNGASAEGSPNGTPSEVLQFNGIELPVADADEILRRLGPTQFAYSHYGGAVGLGLRHALQVDQAGSVVLRRHAQGMAISWPGHIKDKGGIRWQFHHVIDIVPTILRSDRHPGAGHGRRHRAEADRRREHGLHLRQGERRTRRRRTRPSISRCWACRGCTMTAGC